MEDFLHAIHEVQPAFGASTDDLDVAAMVNASEVKDEPAQCLFSLKLPNCKSMPLDTRQRDLPPQPCFEDNAARTVPLPELGRPYAAELQARCLQPSPLQSLLWSHHDKESCGKRFSMSDMRSWCAAAAATPHGALESSQKGLMIFDQSGNLIAGSSMKSLPLELSWEATKPL
ncbi:hypothetical protein YC2023_004986 [Brassica napus]